MIYRSFSITELFTVFCFVLLLSSCRTAGIYSSNPKDKIAFAGIKFQLTKSDSFYLYSWTDNFSKYVDKDGNRIFKEEFQYRGFGTYDCQGDSLELSFSNEDSITVVLDFNKGDENTKVGLYIINEMGNKGRPNISFLNDENVIITKISMLLDNQNSLVISNNENPHLIRIDGMGMNIENPEIDISKIRNGRYTFKRKTYDGYYAKGTKKKIWFKRRPTGIRYQLNERKRYLPKKWGWNWLNKLYRDY